MRSALGCAALGLAAAARRRHLRRRALLRHGRGTGAARRGRRRLDHGAGGRGASVHRELEPPQRGGGGAARRPRRGGRRTPAAAARLRRRAAAARAGRSQPPAGAARACASRRPSPAAAGAMLAPPALVLRDPLGLAQRTISASGPDEILVLPRTYPVRAHGGGGEACRRARPRAADGRGRDRDRRPAPARRGDARVAHPLAGAGSRGRPDGAQDGRRGRLAPARRARPARAGATARRSTRPCAPRRRSCCTSPSARAVGLLLPGDRRATTIAQRPANWPTAHVRLALLDSRPRPGAGRGAEPPRPDRLRHRARLLDRAAARPRPHTRRAAPRRPGRDRPGAAPSSRSPAATATSARARRRRRAQRGGGDVSGDQPPSADPSRRPRRRGSPAADTPAGGEHDRLPRAARRRPAAEPARGPRDRVLGARCRSAPRTGCGCSSRPRPSARGTRSARPRVVVAGSAGRPARWRASRGRHRLAALAGGLAWRSLAAGVGRRAAQARRAGTSSSAGIARGVDSLPGARVPYRGLDEWLRSVIPLGGTALAVLAAALAFWPRRGGRTGFPVLARCVGARHAVRRAGGRARSSTTSSCAAPLLALLVVAFLRLERLRRRDARGRVAGGAAPRGLSPSRSRPRIDGVDPWWDYETLGAVAGRLALDHVRLGPRLRAAATGRATVASCCASRPSSAPTGRPTSSTSSTATLGARRRGRRRPQVSGAPAPRASTRAARPAGRRRSR